MTEREVTSCSPTTNLRPGTPGHSPTSPSECCVRRSWRNSSSSAIPELVGFGFDDATPGRAEPVTFPVATRHAPTVVLSGHDPDQMRPHVVGMDGGWS
jgi:hypothetical protein